jgi:Fe-S-cluster-containing dehydrogenase component
MPKSVYKFVAVDREKCTGCGICEAACSFEKEKVFSSNKSRIKSVRVYPVINVAIACRLCAHPACVMACPCEALEQSEENGVILTDEDKCDGCGWCIEACEFGTITVHPEKKVAIICDLCDGEPKCVDWCPEEALKLTTKDALAHKIRIIAVKKLFKEALGGEDVTLREEA